MNIDILNMPPFRIMPTIIYATPDGHEIDFRGRIYYSYNSKTDKYDIPCGVCINRRGNLIIPIEEFTKCLYEDVYNIRQQQYAEEAKYL